MKTPLAIALSILSIALAGCAPRVASPPASAGDASGGAYAVDISPEDFVEVVDNPYFPLLPGSRYVFESETADGLERIVVEVLAERRTVMGIPATVVHDTVTLDGELVEDTYDWYAQDRQGNVWYLGEDVSNFEAGVLVDHAGSWEAGVDGALPGIIMFADPAAHVGETYRQEYYPGVAEDMAEVLGFETSVAVPFGTFENVLRTRDFTPLEPGVQEEKYYALGIGSIQVVNLSTGEAEWLVEFVGP